jgi:hypothetical protein
LAFLRSVGKVFEAFQRLIVSPVDVLRDGSAAHAVSGSVERDGLFSRLQNSHERARSWKKSILLEE